MHALLLIDIQNDFLPGGALGVPDGDAVIPIANALMADYACVVATRDWHPPNHLSFASQHPGQNVGDVVTLGSQPQVLWPDHCVQGSHGADFAAELDVRRIDHVIFKGTEREIDSYSGFFDNDHRHATGLDATLKRAGVDAVDIVGLATDYCVRFTALDARQLGYTVRVFQAGVRGVNLAAGDSDKALAEMQAAGVTLVV
ncbi:bifunctional nicotinamidase/pyrazinamidase [Roseimaritima sediminicola]|uniref:bifunctional nicotinamidase/pyrazinamidase n=1 Tax=Roseimaritima sediminicola TaxID=2662066 RepID=UPI001298445C|nr:bifunctional nicotinamidase/pyrazinamidase [Roseimaritima sediminicola]